MNLLNHLKLRIKLALLLGRSCRHGGFQSVEAGRTPVRRSGYVRGRRQHGVIGALAMPRPEGPESTLCGHSS
jgi:hypothetical protein